MNNEVYLQSWCSENQKQGLPEEAVPCAREEWLLWRGHEPIVRETGMGAKADGQQAAKNKRGDSDRWTNEMRRPVFAECFLRAKKEKYKLLLLGYKNYGKERTSHAIGWKTLNLGPDDIRRNAHVAAIATRKYVDMLTASRTDKQKKETDNHKRELKSTEKRVAELDKIIAKLYEDSALGKINEQRAHAMMAAYEQEQRDLKAKLETLTTAIGRAESVRQCENFVSLIKRYTDIQELSAPISTN